MLGATPLYPPRSRVGAWLTTHEFLAGLAARGHTVEVATSLADLTYTLDGVQVIGRVPHLRRKASQYDVVVSHLGDTGDAAKAADHAGVPSVRMVHGADPNLAQRLDVTPTSLAVFNSATTATAAQWTGAQIVCHPPVHPEQHQTTPGDRVTLVNLSPEKGVEVFTLLASSLPDVKFLGVRGGYGRQRIRGGPNVEISGCVEDMREVWSRTRVLLMPSISETYGRVGVEAMCSGIPVIAHPTPGLLESLGDAGIFVDRSDPSGWREQVQRLQDPDEWAAASAKALERAAELDPAGSVERFCSAVEQLVEVPA